MKRIVYYVAVSLDGFISGVGGDISGFVGQGNLVQKYLRDLQEFKTVIMGRKTYEFGYQFGLKPGQPAYPHMDHYIFSEDLFFQNPAPNVHVKSIDLDTIDEIRKTSLTDIYLCGGGQFAGWLLDNQRVDILKLKVNPLVLGRGVRIFGSSDATIQPVLTSSQQYDDGLLLNTYRIDYDQQEATSI